MATSVLIGQVSGFIVAIYLLKRKHEIGVFSQFTMIRQGVIASFIMGVAVLSIKPFVGFNFQSLILLIFTGIGVYTIVCIFFWYFFKDKFFENIYRKFKEKRSKKQI